MEESALERERRIRAHYELRNANSSIFSWPTKLLMFALVVGGCTYIALHYFRPQLAALFPGLTNDPVAGPVEESSGALKLPGVPATISDGAIGDQLLKDDVILDVIDTKSIELNKRGVAIYVISAIIGNGGKKPMNCPAVEGVMFDTDDRQYAAIQREGQYNVGQSLNPLLCLDQRWAFIVPEGVTFKRFELTLPSHNIITVDLTRRTAGNKAFLVAAEVQRMKTAQESFASRLADIEDRKNRDEQAKSDALTTIVNKTAETRDSMNARVQDDMQKKALGEKNVQKLQKRVKNMENLVNTGQAAVDKWCVALKKARLDLEEVHVQFGRATAHDQLRLQAAVAKAQENVDLQDKRLTDATLDLSDRQLKLKNANLDLDQETRALTLVGNEITHLNAELEKLDNTLEEHQKKLDELKNTDETETLKPIDPNVKKLPTAPPPPPPDPESSMEK